MLLRPSFKYGSGIFTTSVDAARTLLKGKNTVVIKNKTNIILIAFCICLISSLFFEMYS